MQWYSSYILTGTASHPAQRFTRRNVGRIGLQSPVNPRGPPVQQFDKADVFAFGQIVWERVVTVGASSNIRADLSPPRWGSFGPRRDGMRVAW
jgi:hypothetical protein